MRARIYKSTGTWYIAKDEQGGFHHCRMKGKFKIDKDITSTNPIAVGDWVTLEIEAGDEPAVMITSIEQRKNYVIRISPHNKHQKHIVASNLDQSLIIATLKEPRTSTGFIDRLLVSCEAYHIPAKIVFNKADIYGEEELEAFHYLRTLYNEIGYPVYLISAEKKIGMEELSSLLKNQVTLFSGHSGVGKSTMMNCLFPEKEIATQEVSAWSGKGMHTTTFAEMYDLREGGQVIDTPGIRELGIMNIQREELSGYFPEMKERLQQCRFNNCSHFNEPDCAIKKAVQEGSISEERYISYLRMYESIDDKKY